MMLTRSASFSTWARMWPESRTVRPLAQFRHDLLEHGCIESIH
jgi:hypothetical protein